MTSKQPIIETRITKRDLHKVFVRSIAYNSSFNYARQLNLGWAWSMMPILRKLYGDDEEAMAQALQRHLVFNNITPFISTLLMSITAALEEKNATSDNFDVDTINDVKVGLMGPLSAIGDSIFFGCIRVIGSSIGASLALQGNIMGPILYLLIFNIPNFASRYWLVLKGYELGSSFLTNVQESGILDKIFKGAGILGLTVIGAMVASNVNVPITIMFDKKTSLLSTLDTVMPNLLPLLFTGGVYFLLKKELKPITIIACILGFGLLGAFVGIF